MLVIGIDPGRKGAIAHYRTTDRKPSFIPFDEKAYADFFFSEVRCICSTDAGGVVCTLEKVWARPGEAPSLSFQFGENYGFIRGLLEGVGIPYTSVAPIRWQRRFFLSGDKEQHISLAKSMFRGVDLRRTTRCKKDHDGFADALLIGEYGLLETAKC